MTDLTRVGIKVALELYLSAENDWLLREHLELMFDSGHMNNIDHVLQVIEEEEAPILFPIIVKLMEFQLLELKEKLRNVNLPGIC